MHTLTAAAHTSFNKIISSFDIKYIFAKNTATPMISSNSRKIFIEYFKIALKHMMKSTKLKRNLTSAMEISQHNVNSSFFCDLRQKKKKLLKKTDIYHYFDQNGTKLTSMYSITLLTEKKKIESAAQIKRNHF